MHHQILCPVSRSCCSLSSYKTCSARICICNQRCLLLLELRFSTFVFRIILHYSRCVYSGRSCDCATFPVGMEECVLTTLLGRSRDRERVSSWRPPPPAHRHPPALRPVLGKTHSFPPSLAFLADGMFWILKRSRITGSSFLNVLNNNSNSNNNQSNSNVKAQSE